MTKTVERVHHDPVEIARIESLVVELDDASLVEVTTQDGTRHRGIVTARPTVQTFRDADGNEGVNSLLRLDDQDQPGESHLVWLDRIVDVRHLGSA